MDYTSITDMDLGGKVVLLRGDLNVPAKDGTVTDTTRIDRLKRTVDYLIDKGAKTLVLSHFGRPKGERNMEYSLNFLAPVLESQWGCKVQFADDCIGESAKSLAGRLQPGQVGLLENVRFHKGEEKNDPDFTRQLADIGDIFVNDAFSAAHRAHASTEGLAHILPSAAGFLMEAEVSALTKALEAPKKPVVAVVGGAKISTKLSVLDNLVKKVDFLVLGGGMANTFMFAQGIEVGKSLCEKDMAEEARKIMKTAESAGCRIVLPIDRVIVSEFRENAPFEVVASETMPEDKESIDVGPETIRNIGEILESAKTVLWNGPLGVFEMKPFDRGTNEVARKVAELTSEGRLLSVAGGGDTVSALENAGVVEKFSYVSTAGGAFLEWLEGKELPGVAALAKARKAA
ncbi:MAG: phosphoglycerate kinase [Alphaproteobacteria bacterium]|nr:phosphoglycerate kinase [Alphaproteobacteria bacterium]